MRRRRKRLITLALSFVLAMTMALGLTGCRVDDYLPEYENEYFRYAVRMNKDGTQEGYLIGFTELGAEQTELILLQEIDGIPIVGFGYARILGVGHEDVGEFVSDKLEKLYIPFVVQKKAWSNYLNTGSLRNGAIVQWKSADIWLKSKSVINGFKTYQELLRVGYFENSRTNYYNTLANVSYMYNYADAVDDGYYWVDSYDNSIITFIPPEPTRKGYHFAGWYKEPECENAWDFSTDKTGEELPIDMSLITSEAEAQYTENDGLKLYAKWIKED